MADNKLLEQKETLENGALVLTQTLQKTLSRADLENNIAQCKRNKQQLVLQMIKLKEQYGAVETEQQENERLLALIPEETLDMTL